jgi:hypothetical protein
MIVPKAKITKELLRKVTEAVHDEHGHEHLNPIPHTPEGIRPKEMTLRSRIQRILKNELSLLSESQDLETFDEANDFDIEDTFDREAFSSKYELMDDEEPLYQDIPDEEFVDFDASGKQAYAHNGSNDKKPEDSERSNPSSFPRGGDFDPNESEGQKPDNTHT